MAEKKDEMCPFCDYFKLENKTWVAAWEPFPVGIGHMKLMPKRHDAKMTDLTSEEHWGFWELFNRAMNYLDTQLGRKPDGYNIGINIGEAAGQTIGHLHIHIIPRYKGDMPNPRGGVRNIKDALVKW
jgi:diadenosine tetraphosphate (Ap4A) HIT family hydrolase